ncbi:MAG: UDP-N-acetylglucosamine 2-epimerase (non-hydrolyzing) [Spirochaetes bacterium]|nr:UDP-N-acetylglucosamine 2-epimerase (non-hydrolyzing) [Spirochaetota bacterium]
MSFELKFLFLVILSDFIFLLFNFKLNKEFHLKKIVTIVGARPQFIKAAVISRLIKSEYSENFQEILVHTGQHYDQNMSDVFFDEMQIPRPDINLEIGSGSHGKMTGRMLEKIEDVLVKEDPHFLMVYGDTNSTIAGALAASKLHIPVIHVEAGLRSFNMKMPEEQNRILTDHISNYLFCPTQTAIDNLLKEGITEGVFKTGDIMLDASLYYRKLLKTIESKLSIPQKKFILATLHRAENTDDPEKLNNIISALSESSFPVVLPIHPRTRKMMQNIGVKLSGNVNLIDPVGFFDMLRLETACSMIVTDSGGVQKEAYFFKKPCITMREQTEWVETVESGWNILVGSDKDKILDAINNFKSSEIYPELYGNGNAGQEILDVLLKV